MVSQCTRVVFVYWCLPWTPQMSQEEFLSIGFPSASLGPAQVRSVEAVMTEKGSGACIYNRLFKKGWHGLAAEAVWILL